MPIEAALLRDAPYPKVRCPKCGHFPLEPFMRGIVQRSCFRLSLRGPFLINPQPYCAIICSQCKEIVGYEAPAQWKMDTDAAS